MAPGSVPHPTMARALSHVQQVSMVGGGLLILASLLLPWVTVRASDSGAEQVILGTDQAMLVAAGGVGSIVAGLALPGRLQLVARIVGLCLGTVVLMVAATVSLQASEDLIADDLLAQVTLVADVESLVVSTGGGIPLAFIGAGLVLLGALAASRDGVPGEHVSAVLGIPIGDAEPDPAVSPGARLVLLLGPTVVIGAILVVVLGLYRLAGGSFDA